MPKTVSAIGVTRVKLVSDFNQKSDVLPTHLNELAETKPVSRSLLYNYWFDTCPETFPSLSSMLGYLGEPLLMIETTRLLFI